MLNNFKVREEEMHQVTFTTKEGEVKSVLVGQYDYEIKWMMDGTYVMLIGLVTYGAKERYEATTYKIEKVRRTLGKDNSVLCRMCGKVQDHDYICQECIDEMIRN